MWKKLKYLLITKGAGFYINTLHLIHAKSAANIAYNLFATPRKGKLKEIPTFLNSSVQKKLTYKDYTIQTYEWANKGEKVLLIHGWESNTTRWKEIIKKLSKQNYHIIALDAPAQGLNKGKELNAVLYGEFINEVANYFKPSALIGHSLGGMTMLHYYDKFKPNFVTKIISLGAPNRFLRITDNYKNVLSLSKRSYSEFLKEFPRRFNVNPAEFNSEVFIKSIQIPLGIIHDKHDNIVPFSDAEEIINKHSKTELFVTENKGHSLYHKSINEQIIYFLENNRFKS